MMIMPRVRIAVTAAIAIGIVSGCHPRPRTASEPCLGTEYLVVRNDSRETIDIGRRHGVSSFDVIGTVGPGVSEIQFPTGEAPKGAYFGARRVSDGGWMAVENGGTRASVSVKVECSVPRP